MEGGHAVEYVEEAGRFYNHVLCDAKPIFVVHGRDSPLSEALDLRRISLLSPDALQDAFTLGDRHLSRWRDYHIVVLRENDFVGLTRLLQGSAFHASVKLFTVDVELIQRAAPFLLPQPPPRPKLYRDAMFPHRILDDEHLYLGSMDAAKNPLLPRFCQRVVDASNLDRAVHAERGVEYLHVKVWDDDGENIAEWFKEVCVLIPSIRFDSACSQPLRNSALISSKRVFARNRASKSIVPQESPDQQRSS